MSLDIDGLGSSTPFIITRSGLPDSDASRRLVQDIDAGDSPLAELGEGLREDLQSASPLSDIQLSEDARKALESADEALSLARAFNNDDASEAFGRLAAKSLRNFTSDLFDRLGGDVSASATQFDAVFSSLSAEFSSRVGSLVDKAAFGGFELTALSISVRAESFELSIDGEAGQTTIQFERFELSVELFHIEAGVVADDRFPVDLRGLSLEREENEAARLLTDVLGLPERQGEFQDRVRAVLGNILAREPLAGLLDSTDGILGNRGLIDARV